MKTCVGCAFAEWNKTKSGRLSPTGDGRCGYEVKLPQLPAAFYWLGSASTGGGHINRKKELREHCPMYQRAPK